MHDYSFECCCQVHWRLLGERNSPQSKHECARQNGKIMHLLMKTCYSFMGKSQSPSTSISPPILVLLLFYLSSVSFSYSDRWLNCTSFSVKKKKEFSELTCWGIMTLLTLTSLFLISPSRSLCWWESHPLKLRLHKDILARQRNLSNKDCQNSQRLTEGLIGWHEHPCTHSTSVLSNSKLCRILSFAMFLSIHVLFFLLCITEWPLEC